MTTFWRSAVAVSLIAAIASCNLLKKKDEGTDAAADAAVAEVPDSAPVAAARAPASNEADIARFPDETKLEDVAASIQRWANVREAPVSGKVVTALNKGASVVEIGQRDKYFLIVFDNPKDSTKKLLGWIHQDAFTPAPAVDAGIKPLTCAAGETTLFSDTPFCGKVCSANTDCPAGQACKGSAQKLVGGKPADSVTVCTVFSPPDAGAPTPPTVVDAGAPKVDAGPPAPAADIVDPTGGACPTGYQLVSKDKKCHRTCFAFNCRKETQFCIKCDGVKVCSATRDLCK